MSGNIIVIIAGCMNCLKADIAAIYLKCRAVVLEVFDHSSCSAADLKNFSRTVIQALQASLQAQCHRIILVKRNNAADSHDMSVIIEAVCLFI